MRVLALSGSLRADSFNTRLLRVASEEAPPGIEVTFWRELAAVPPYDQDLDVLRAPLTVEALRRSIVDADAPLIATPEYNGSVPGHLKTALDWASRPFPDNALRGKPVALISASPGARGAAGARADLRKVLGVIGANVLDDELGVPSVHQRFDVNGALPDGAVRNGIRDLLEQLETAASAHRVELSSAA